MAAVLLRCCGWALLLPLLLSSLLATALVREANTSLAFPPAPPSYGYSTRDAFPGLRFGAAVGVASPAGETNRLFIVDKSGIIHVITNLAKPTKSVFLDLSKRVYNSGESGLLGLAFHPGYATNGYFYVFHSLITSTSQAANHLHQRLARYQVSATDPNLADATSELVLITQSDPADNHNGGDLHFGRDGYLYVSLGDGGVQYDGSHNSQRIDLNFFSGILRLDVDRRPGNLHPNPHPANSDNYFIPADNPYVGATSFNGQVVVPGKVRSEFFAVGFRNPWRFSFDSLTGQLYCGDVGQDAYEEVDVVESGDNCGWAYREGFHNGYKGTVPAGVRLKDPIVEYAHGSGASQGNAVIGGVVYRGSAISQLYGAYVYGDNTSGNIWAVRYQGTNRVTPQRLTGRADISAFGVDPATGDVLVVTVATGTVYRLGYDGVAHGTPLPPSLAETGAFAELGSLAPLDPLSPMPGLIPYNVNVPFWSDHARKHRWISVPGTTTKLGFSATTNWTFPTGTVWAKHFDLEMTNGVPESARRIETRFIVKTGDGVYGLTYRWGASATNAVLVPEAGMDETFTIRDGDNVRTQTWHYPSRSECLRCHTAAAGYALGFNTLQLNRETEYGMGPENQLIALSQAGYLDTRLDSANSYGAFAAATNGAVSLGWRVRSYLAVNCAPCHQPGGGAVALWDARPSVALGDAGIVKGPLENDFGDPLNRVVVPGDPVHSVLLKRISTRGNLQMPPLASTVLDDEAISLVSDWITRSLPTAEDFPSWQQRIFGDVARPEAAAGADPDGDGANNELEWLTGKDPLNPADSWRLAVLPGRESITLSYERIADRLFELQWSADPRASDSWNFLDVPENQPKPGATNATVLITVPVTNNLERFYRVQIRTP